MACADRARRLSRHQPGHGLVVRHGTRPLPQEPARGARLAGPHRARARSGDRRRGLDAATILGLGVDARTFRIVCGVLLIAWGLYHALYGHSHRVRIGLTTGSAGLFAWSFAMAMAHGAA